MYLIIIGLLSFGGLMFGAEPVSAKEGGNSSPFTHTFDEAVAWAQSKHCPFLLFFNGSDCSGLGMKMKKEVLNSPAFLSAIEGQLLCYEVDFPEHRALDPQLLALHQNLKEVYQVTELPMLLLVGPDTREIARMGYFPASGEELAADLLKLMATEGQLQLRMCRLHTLSTEELKETYELALKFPQPDRLNKILESGAHSHDPGFFLLEQYRYLSVIPGDARVQEIRQRLFALDPNNKLGYPYHIALIDFQSLASQSPPVDAAEVIRPLSAYLKEFGLQDRENVWRIEMIIAQFFLEQDSWQSALTHAEMAYLNAPTELQREIDPLLQYIRSQAS